MINVWTDTKKSEENNILNLMTIWTFLCQPAQKTWLQLKSCCKVLVSDFSSSCPISECDLILLVSAAASHQAIELARWCVNAVLSGQYFIFCEERTNCCVFISFQDLTNSHRWVSWSASHRFMRCSGLLMSHSDLGCQFVWLNTRDYLTLGHPHRYGNWSQMH